MIRYGDLHDLPNLLIDQVGAGNVSVTYIDETVKSILRTKFALGLFEGSLRSMDSPNL